jgi:hypothetical protein
VLQRHPPDLNEEIEFIYFRGGGKKIGVFLKCGFHAFLCHLDIMQIQFDPDAAAIEPEADDGRRATAQKRVQHQVAFVRRGQ